MVGMFAPVLDVDGQPRYVNPTLIQEIRAGEILPVNEYGAAPDGNAWPTSWLIFGPDSRTHVRGTPEMILGSWFGRPANKASNIVVPPPGVRLS